MISRTSLILISLLFLSKMGISQSPAKPKLIIGIVVDQMRFDYLYKYWDRYCEDGFRKLVNEGYQCKNLQYNYVPTYTGPGHTSIYTGTTPERHGIVSNDWFEIKSKESVYCSEDKTVNTIGSETAGVGRMSPINMLSTTIGDELRVATNLRSRVFGVALKDRASILPAGHIANAAYWFDSKTGNWVSSSYYMNKLPEWLKKYNQSQPAMKYLNGNWETLYDINSYTSSKPDSNAYERLFKGKTSATFPYNLSELMPLNDGQGLIRSTPFGNTITRELAEELIKQEKLGKGNFSDMLCISFSSTDYVGHHFGTDAIETEDTYLRLDADLAKLLKFLNEWVGDENLLVFLTADHGGATVPSYLMDLKVPGGYMNYSIVTEKAEAWIKEYCGLDSVLLKLTNDQIYLDEKSVIKAGKNPKELQQLLADSLLLLNGIHYTSTATNMTNEEYTRGTKMLMQKGFYAKRSGQVLMSMEPNWIEYAKTGTTHGSAYSYDTRVPMLWYGWEINSGSTADSYFIDDIAPTLSWLLNIPFPNACSGNPIRIPLKNYE
jgi:predicted AlkP superfamily pyrophosphatase or phosphodiesterase